MRRLTLRHVRRRDGFSTLEMVLLLAVIAAFLFGVVVLAGRGLSSVQPSKGDAEMKREATHLLDRIEALVLSARAFSTQPGTAPALANTRLLFVADLDGSGGRVRFADGGTASKSTGLETVSISRSSEGPTPEVPVTGRNLFVRVLGGSQKTSQIRLTSMLDPADPLAFSISYRGGDGRSLNLGRAESGSMLATAVRALVKLRSRGESRVYTRLIRLENPTIAGPVELPH